MLASALRRHRGDGPFHDLEQRLLHALARHVARDRRIVGFAALRISLGVGIPSRDFTSEDLFSSLTMSMHSSTHSSQMNTVGPAMSLRTSCWLLPQNEQ